MRVCVFLGSSLGISPVYAAAARDFGRMIAGRGYGLVYGGGSIGLMGVIADAASEAGGEVIGVIPEALRRREFDHRGLAELHVVKSMHERKALMAELSDGFVALPGGIGTFEELFETWTWAQLGYHDKPCGLLNVNGFYDAMSGFIDHVVAEGFLRPADRARLIVTHDPAAMLDAVAGFVAPPARRWIDDSEA
ncbi:TIGR00730 family Rossman fold protein [Sphingomonas solaris]|uniref:Cytokinin riboside 5'-monophosphate phosphoribohydrolase n=1 Tax=Alterirhizorhabdus solaris TaxID=2529389 RepID=A0A558QZ48_9SPHN|nr:TIGR00730 family Rossman fold protein [Sphingomonas solaris]TVV72433.1 TIGR00730 family Rossman fold protein [Sphingomonas solaris]